MFHTSLRWKIIHGSVLPPIRIICRLERLVCVYQAVTGTSPLQCDWLTGIQGSFLNLPPCSSLKFSDLFCKTGTARTICFSIMFYVSHVAFEAKPNHFLEFPSILAVQLLPLIFIQTVNTFLLVCFTSISC